MVFSKANASKRVNKVHLKILNIANRQWKQDLRKRKHNLTLKQVQELLF